MMNQERTFKKSVRTALGTFALLMAVSASAFAATVTAQTTIYVREQPNADSKPLTVMTEGTKTESLGTTGNWTKVTVNGVTGYACTSYLTTKDDATTQPSTPSTGTYVQATTSVNVRDTANGAGTVIAGLSKGQKVEKLGTVGDWTKISVNGKTGYVYSKYLTAVSASTDSSTTTSTYVYTTASVNIRDNANSAGGVIATVAAGTKVEKTGTVGDWTKVKYNGKTGYIYSKYVSTSAPAEKQYLYASQAVKMYDTANSSGDVVANIAMATRVEKLKVVGDWTQVSVNGKTGYIESKYLKIVAPSPSDTETMYTTAAVNVRSKASTSGSILTSVAKGTKVLAISTSNGWTFVEVNGKSGYISSAYLSKTAPSTPVAKTYLYVTASSLSVHKTASSAAATVTTVKRGDKVERVGTSGNWSKIVANGKTGYIATKHLTTAAPSTKVYMYVTASSLNVRKTPSSKASAVTTVKKGDQVQKLGTSGNWTEIVANGKTGYIASKYLNAENPVATSSYVKTTASVNVRSTASNSGSIVTSVAKGVKLQKLGTSGGWTKVSANGKTGYIYSKYVTAA